VRWALRRENGAILNSARIDDIRELEAEGRRWVEVSGGGWGHGIGMCQVGAMARARFGQDYRRILGAYYPGTELQRLY
jgi:stage II sporulation protein D